MEVTQSPSTAEAVPAADARMSPFARAIAVFTNPGGAWAGLKVQKQWWFPLLLIVLFSAGMTATLYERAIVPMQAAQMDQMVEEGRLTPEQAEQQVQMMSGPMGLGMGLIFGTLFLVVIMLLIAAGVSFGVSFMLGHKLSYRLGLEIVCWANLIMLPAGVLNGILAWSRETMRGIHLGPGILVPMADPPEKWQVAAASFLDAFGPFELWTVAVVIIGASTLSGAPRQSVLWTMGGLYVAARLIAAGLAMVMPGA